MLCDSTEKQTSGFWLTRDRGQPLAGSPSAFLHGHSEEDGSAVMSCRLRSCAPCFVSLLNGEIALYSSFIHHFTHTQPNEVIYVCFDSL